MAGMQRSGLILEVDGLSSFLAGVGKASGVTTDFGKNAETASKGVDALGKSTDRAGSHVKDFFKTAFSFAAGGLIIKAIDGIGKSVRGLVKGMVGGNADFEGYNTQFKVMLGSAEEAKTRLAELADFGAKTPFELPGVVEADMVLQGFGLHSEEAAKKFGYSGAEIRTIAGDVASGTGSDFKEMSLLIGKFSAGATGEAISRMQELGITNRDELTKMGLQFSKSGELLSPLPQAMNVVLGLMKTKYGGLMDAQSSTFNGMASNLSDWIAGTLRKLGVPIFDVLKVQLGNLLTFLNSPETMAAVDAFANGLATGIQTGVNWITTTGIPTMQSIGSAISTNVITPAKDAVTAFNDWKAFGTEWGIVAALQSIGENFPLVQPLTDWLETKIPASVRIVTDAFGLARDTYITFRDALQGEWTPNAEAIHPLHEAVGEFGLMIHDDALPALGDLYNSLITEAPVAWATFKQSIDQDVIPVLQWMSDHLKQQKDEDLPGATYSWQSFGNDVALVLNDTTDGMNQLGALVRSEFIKQAEAAKSNWDSIGTNVQGALTLVETSVTTTYQLIVTETEKKLGEVVVWFAGLPGRITGALGDLGSLLVSAGADLITGLLNGLKSIEIGSVLGGIITSGIAAAKAMAGIKSPSTKTRDQLGKPMGEGIVVGLESTAPSLKQALGKIMLGLTIPSDALQHGSQQGERYGQAIGEGVAKKLKTMLGQTIPADAIPFAGQLGADLGAAMGDAAVKKVKSILGQGIPGAVADVSKALRSDKNRSDEAKPGKMGNLGQYVTQGEGVLGGIVASAGEAGAAAASKFAGLFDATLQETKPVMITQFGVMGTDSAVKLAYEFAADGSLTEAAYNKGLYAKDALMIGFGHPILSASIVIDGPGGGGGTKTGPGGKGGEVPSYAKGVENFAGGLAFVHAGELLVNLPRGTSVIPAMNTVAPPASGQQIMRQAAAGAVTNYTVDHPTFVFPPGTPQRHGDDFLDYIRSRGY